MPFTAIVDTVAGVLGSHAVPLTRELTVDDVLGADAWARAVATRVIAEGDGTA